MRIPFVLLCLLVSPLLFAEGDCEFNADDADSPSFMDKIVKCETPRERAKKELGVVPAASTEVPVVRLYGDGSKNGMSGISERPVVAPGSLNHKVGGLYDAREIYSLRTDAKFEESVTLAIHRLHLQMAHYCARGWFVDKQWSIVDPSLEGRYFLHYRFSCVN